MTTASKINNIQALRGLAALLVLFTHVMTMERKYSHSGRLLPDWCEIGTSGVDLFFVISGFIMVHITRGWFHKPQAVRQFLANRVTRIYPLYWLYSGLVLLVYLWRPQWVNASQGHEANLAASLLLLPQDKLPLLAVGWSLTYEMYFYLVFAGLLMLRERYAPWLAAFWLVTVTAVHFTMGSLHSPVLAVMTSPYCLEFGLGCLVAFLAGRGVTLSPWMLIAALLAVAGGWFLGVERWNAAIVPEWRILIYGMPYALLVHALVSAEARYSFTCPRWLIRIGDASYSVYLSHFLIISAIGRLWTGFDMAGRADNALIILLMVALPLAWGRFSYTYLERPMLQSWGRVRLRLERAFAT